jgi:hypothetical protein
VERILIARGLAGCQQGAGPASPMKGFPQFPQASTLATPFHDPIADSIDEYQAFLKTLVYSPIAKAAFGKRV